MTFYYKRVIPAIWFGFLVLFMALPLVALLSGGSISGSPVAFLVVMALVFAAGYLMMRKSVFGFVDEVLDAGDGLVVRDGQREEQIALADIINVSYSPLLNPLRVKLSLRAPSMFGDQVSFCAPASFMPLRASPIIEELVNRIDVARSSQRQRTPQ